MRVSDRLTDIAELIVQCCMDLAWAADDRRCTACLACGETDGAARIVKVAVAGYGKLGGLELGYGSDLDLVFLHDSAGEFQQTDAARVDNGVFFLRLGQRIVHLLTMHSAAGRLYEVDMRLRPNGKGGFLMTGIDAFETYQRQNAWTWEHQALLRARAVAGDAALVRALRGGAPARAVHRRAPRHACARTSRRCANACGASCRSRAAGSSTSSRTRAGSPISSSWCSTGCWSGPRDHPELVTYSDNVRQLEGLAAAGLVELETAHWLKETYIGYRTLLHHLSLEGGERVVEAAEHAQRRARVREIWRETFG